MIMIAKTKGISPGMSQAQKIFTSCRHRAGHQQPMRTSCGLNNTQLQQKGNTHQQETRQAGADLCTGREKPNTILCKAARTHPSLRSSQTLPQVVH